MDMLAPGSVKIVVLSGHTDISAVDFNMYTDKFSTRSKMALV